MRLTKDNAREFIQEIWGIANAARRSFQNPGIASDLRPYMDDMKNRHEQETRALVEAHEDEKALLAYIMDISSYPTWEIRELLRGNRSVKSRITRGRHLYGRFMEEDV